MPAATAPEVTIATSNPCERSSTNVFDELGDDLIVELVALRGQGAAADFDYQPLHLAHQGLPRHFACFGHWRTITPRSRRKLLTSGIE